MQNGKIDTISLYEDIQKIKEQAPLVHNITNYVVMNSTANALFAIGASPVMAHAIEEVEEMVGISRALVINIGTLSELWIEAMQLAMKKAKEKNIPIIFDPVGAGATRLRTDTCHKLLNKANPSIIRGNASEIRALFLAEGGTKGVDSTHSADDAIESAKELSKKFNCVISISGKTDIIIEGEKIIRINNGHRMMTKVTGLGCTATALTGAFAAVNSSPFIAAAHGMALMGIAGEIAAEKSTGPGSLQVQFFDTLYNLKEEDIIKRLKLE